MKDTNETIRKIGELNNNAQFVEELKQAKTASEAVKVFANYGAEVTESELNDLITRNKAYESGELSAEELEEVAGGINWWKIAKGLLSILEGIFMSEFERNEQEIENLNTAAEQVAESAQQLGETAEEAA